MTYYLKNRIWTSHKTQFFVAISMQFEQYLTFTYMPLMIVSKFLNCTVYTTSRWGHNTEIVLKNRFQKNTQPEHILLFQLQWFLLSVKTSYLLIPSISVNEEKKWQQRSTRLKKSMKLMHLLDSFCTFLVWPIKT